jgi:hypothetical protein
VSKILVIDTEPKWLTYCKRQGADTCTTIEDALHLLSTREYRSVIVTSLLIDYIPALILAGARVEVATAQITTSEAGKAYRNGAADYWVKDWDRRL